MTRSIPPVYARALALVLVALSLSSCSRARRSRNPASAGSDVVLARVGDEELTAAELGPGRRLALDPSTAARQKLLDEEVRQLVLAEEAKRRGLDRDPAVVRAHRQQLVAALIRQEVDERVKPETIDETALRRYYDEHVSDFTKAEQVRVGAIVVKEEETAKRVATEARTARVNDRAKDQTAFRALVARWSEDPFSKGQGGDLGYVERRQGTEASPIAQAALELTKLGDVSAPVRVGDAFYVLKLLDRRPAIQRSLDEVGAQIRQLLVKEAKRTKVDEIYESARKETKVEVFENRLVYGSSASK